MKTLLAVFVVACAICAGQAQTNLSTGATNSAVPISAVTNLPAGANAATSRGQDGQNNILTTIIVAVLTAIPATFLSFVFAQRQFRSEKWWERKAEAYSRIVEALYSAIDYCCTRADEDMSGKKISAERDKQLSADYERAYFDLRKATGTGAYIISDEVAQVLYSLECRPRLKDGAGKDWAWFEIYQAEADAYRKALAEIRMLAKKDLGV